MHTFNFRAIDLFCSWNIHEFWTINLGQLCENIELHKDLEYAAAEVELHINIGKPD